MAWNPVANLKGPQGEQGPQGEVGPEAALDGLPIRADNFNGAGAAVGRLVAATQVDGSGNATAFGLPQDVEYSGSLTLVSPTDRLADNERLRITSSQKQETENNQDGGETVWLDLSDPRAKSMLTWRLRYDLTTGLPYMPTAVPEGAPYRRLVWVGAHYYAQDQVDDENPTDVHGHWSVEVPDTTGALRTRLEIPFVDTDGTIGTELTNIKTNQADLTVDATDGGVLRVGGGSVHSKDLVFAISKEQNATKKRWVIRQDTAAEAGSNAGSNLIILGCSDTGTELRPSLAFERKTGRIGVGTLVSAGGNPQLPQATLDVRATDGATNIPTVRIDGIAGQSAATLTVNMVATTDRAFAARLGSETQTRFTFLASGQMEWGDGTASRDTNLYRSAANVLKTDDKLIATQGIGVGNSAVAATPGTVTRKMQVFDAAGASLGFVPIYDAIT